MNDDYILRLLQRQQLEVPVGYKSEKFRRVRNFYRPVMRYNIGAYGVRQTKQGKWIYYLHHYVEESLSTEEVFEKGYDSLPVGSLHNKSVIEQVLKRLDREV